MWTVLAITILLFLLGGFSVSAYAHRTLSHGAVVWNSSILEWVCIYFCIGSGIGSPLGWATVHRMHHAYLDTDKDPHSPWRIGFWRSYFHLWDIKPEQVPLQFAKGLTKKKKLLWIHNHAVPLLIAFHLMPFVIFGLPGILATLAGSALGVHAMGFTNAVNHWAGEPKRIRTTKTWWLQAGENCHEYHHDNPREYSFGKGISDPSARVLELLEKVGLVKLYK